MKTKIIPAMLAMNLLVLLTFSCESKDEGAESAFENLQQDRMITGDSATMGLSEEGLSGPEKSAAQLDRIAQEEPDWRKTLDKLTRANEELIEDIKTIPGLSVECYRKVTKLEKENDAIISAALDHSESDTAALKKFNERMIKEASLLKEALDELNARALSAG